MVLKESVKGINRELRRYEKSNNRDYLRLLYILFTEKSDRKIIFKLKKLRGLK